MHSKVHSAERRIEEVLLCLSVGKANFHERDIQPRDYTDGGGRERCNDVQKPTFDKVSWEWNKAGVM